MAAEPSLAKSVGGPVQDLLLRPFIRRMKFLYTGVLDRDDVFVLGTMDERDFKQTDTAYAIAVVHVSDPALKDSLHAWLRSFHVDPTTPGVVQITTIASAMNKVKWDITKVPLLVRGDGLILLGTEVPEDEEEEEAMPATPYLVDEEEKEEEEEDDIKKLMKILVYHPITSYYNYSKVQAMAQDYCAIFIDKTTPSHFEPVVAHDTLHTVRVMLDADAMAASPVGSVHPYRLRTILTRGLDLINTKHLVGPKKPEPTAIGLRIWRLSGSTLGFGHCYERDGLTLAAIRFNASIVPKMMPQGVTES